MSIVRNVAGIVKGMSITFGEMLEPTQVENYPDGKGPLRGAVLEQRYRGAHVLQRDENGLEKCVACFLCAAACPSNCIYIEAAENTEEVRISSSERYAKVYNIDYNRCIFCGYCVEACPTDAITHGHGFELATLNATNLVMRKEDMLLPVEALAAARLLPGGRLRRHRDRQLRLQLDRAGRVRPRRAYPRAEPGGGASGPRGGRRVLDP
jgi:NADH-quinone oxidoreductase subunit I